MAFRRSALAAIGGCDPQFHAAGDDVDVCWRLQERGWTIGFHPGAMVWHHRRNSVRAYWKQQIGYGRAEAMLERKWPEKYNGPGHVRWAGRMYGPGLTRLLGWRRPRISQGVWGRARCESLSEPAPSLVAYLPQMPEWHLMTATLGAMAGLSVVWSPLRLALPLFIGAILPPVAQAWLSAAGACFRDAARPPLACLGRRLLTAALHLLQPIARLRGRLEEGLTPWRRHGDVRRAPLWTVTTAIWSERWASQDEWLQALERQLRAARTCVLCGDAHDGWDLEVRGGILGAARLLVGVEDHAGGKQLIRLRWWPRVPARGPMFGLVASPIALLNPVPLKIVVDSVLGSRPLPGFLRVVLPATATGSPNALLAVAIGLLLAVAVLGRLQALANKFMQTYVGERLVLGLRAQLVDHAQRLSVSYHDAQGTADALYRIHQDAGVIDKIVVEGVIPFAAATITLVTMIAVTVRLDWQLALVGLAVSPPLFVLSTVYRPRMRRQARRVKKLETSALAIVQETLGALRVVKAFGQEARETERFVRRSSEGMGARIRLALLEGRYGLLVGLTAAAGTAAVLLIGVGHVRAGALTLGQLLMALTYL